MTTPYIDPNLIFAENAPVQDKPAAFSNYDKGWDESRNNDGRPLIPQMNYLTQQADLKNLYIHENGAALPYKEGIAYEENAVVVKDGVLQQWQGGEWVVINKTNHNELLGRDAAEAHPASAILDASGNTQQEITDSIGANWRNKPTGYSIGDKVRLLNGTLVESITAANTSNPNTDMSDWIDSSRTEFSANLVDYLSRQDYKRMLNLDRTLDITTALRAILTKFSVKRTDGDDIYSNAQGICKVRIPKGVFVISDTITMLSPLGLIFEGEGVATTVLLYKKDTGIVFNFQTYLGLKFKDMSIIHQPVSSDKSTWTNTLFNLNGTGGGQRFVLEGVATVGFNIVQKLNHTVNEDTNYATNCQFSHYNTFLYSRSSQAVNNSYARCSWYGVVKRTFDVSSFGHTHIKDSGVVQSGTFFYLGSDAANYGPTAQFILTNVKFEWMNASGTQTNGTTKIIETADSPSILGNFKFTKCGIAGGSGDQSVAHFDIKAGSIRIDVDGGEWGGVNIGIKGFPAGQYVANRSWVRFKDCTVPPNTAIMRTYNDASSLAIPVVFENCSGLNNITLLGSGGTGNNYMLSCDVLNRNQVSNRFGFLAMGASPSTHSVYTYGQNVVIESIRVLAKSAPTSATVNIYLDASKVTLIETLSIPASSLTPQVIKANTSVGLMTTEGVFVEVLCSNPNSAITGFIDVVTTSF